MRVRRFASVPALGATAFVALGVVAAPATARPVSAPTTSVLSVQAVSYPNQFLAVFHRPRDTKTLDPTKLNVVTASSVLAFNVKIRNAGNSGKAHLGVTLWISSPVHGAGITKIATLATIGPNQTKTVTFNHLGPVPFAARTNLTVSVTNGQVGGYVPAHKVYPVIFSLP